MIHRLIASNKMQSTEENITINKSGTIIDC